MRTSGQRFLTGVVFWGAVFALLGNALHPYFPLRTSAQEFLDGVVEASSIWGLVHLSLVLAVLLIGAGIVMIAQRLAGTAARDMGRFATVMAIVGVGLFVVWQGVIDGVVFPALADELVAAGDGAAILATATGMLAAENGLAALSVFIFNGLAFLTFGLTLHRADVFAPALRWVLIVTGAVATAVGAMMFAGIGDAVTFWLFRGAGLVETLALFWMAGQLHRGTSGIEEAPQGVGVATAPTAGPATP